MSVRLALIIYFIMLSGCATTPSMTFLTNVNSIARKDAAIKTHYILLPGGKGMDTNELQFQEYAGYIDNILAERGFVKAVSFQQADIAIFLSYGIGNPQSYQYSYSLPTWGQTGVSSANTYGTLSSYGNMATYSGTTTYIPSYGITGYTTQIGTRTVYTRFLLLDAYDVSTYMRDKKMLEVWKTDVVSTGSSDDLRLVFPYLAVAMEPYLGLNTGRNIRVEVPGNDPSVRILLGQTTSKQ